MFHVFSLVCFLIYGVKRRQVLIAKPRKLSFSRDFMPFLFLLAILGFSIKIIIFFNKIEPIWAHKECGRPRPRVRVDRGP